MAPPVPHFLKAKPFTHMPHIPGLPPGTASSSAGGTLERAMDARAVIDATDPGPNGEAFGRD